MDLYFELKEKSTSDEEIKKLEAELITAKQKIAELEDKIKIVNWQEKTCMEILNTMYIPKVCVSDLIEDLQNNSNGDDYSLANVITMLEKLKAWEK